MFEQHKKKGGTYSHGAKLAEKSLQHFKHKHGFDDEHPETRALAKKFDAEILRCGKLTGPSINKDRWQRAAITFVATLIIMVLLTLFTGGFAGAAVATGAAIAATVAKLAVPALAAGIISVATVPGSRNCRMEGAIKSVVAMHEKELAEKVQSKLLEKTPEAVKAPEPAKAPAPSTTEKELKGELNKALAAIEESRKQENSLRTELSKALTSIKDQQEAAARNNHAGNYWQNQVQHLPQPVANHYGQPAWAQQQYQPYQGGAWAPWVQQQPQPQAVLVH